MENAPRFPVVLSFHALLPDVFTDVVRQCCQELFTAL
jgi:hypothetical protein